MNLPSEGDILNNGNTLVRIVSHATLEDEFFVAAKTARGYHEFVSHRYNPKTGECGGGDYVHTEQEAIDNMNRRAGR